MIAISDEHVAAVCKLGKGAECCSYLVMHPDAGPGFACAKTQVSYLVSTIDLRRSLGTIRAMGDNCPGWDPNASQPAG